MFKSAVILPKNPFVFQQLRFKTIRENFPKTTQQNSPLLKKVSEVELPKTKTLPFHVDRKASGMLPVYRQFKNGNTRVITVVRRVDGSVRRFVRMISEVIPNERIMVKPGNVVKIEGNYADVVREWLTLHKF